MKIKRITRDDVKYLTPADRTAICMIYTHRCLTEDQLYRYYYSKESPRTSYAARHVKKLISETYIQAIYYNGYEVAYFIAPRGIHLVRRLSALDSTKLYGINKDSIDLRWKSSDLKLDPSKINHQITLNEFVLEFDEKADGLGVKYTYWDEKFVPAKDASSRRARADGVIDLPNVTLYLELDMNTERKLSLNNKWKAYRVLLNTLSFWESRQNKPIVILFILENTVMPQVRKATVMRTVYTHFMDCITDNLDLYINTHENIMNLIFNKFILGEEDILLKKTVSDMTSHGFDISTRNMFSNTDLPAYNLFVKNEFWGYFVDSYKYSPVSVLKKIMSAGTNAMLLKSQLNNKNGGYIVAFDDEATLFKDLSIITPFDFDNVIFADISGENVRYFKYDAFFAQHNESLFQEF